MAANRKEQDLEYARLKAMLIEYTAKLSRDRERHESDRKRYDNDNYNDLFTQRIGRYSDEYRHLLLKLAGLASQILDQTSITTIDSIELQLKLAEFEHEVRLLEHRLMDNRY